MRPRNPHVGSELAQVNDIQRAGQRLWVGREPAQPGVSPALPDYAPAPGTGNRRCSGGGGVVPTVRQSTVSTWQKSAARIVVARRGRCARSVLKVASQE
jgi:hypothetical protein